MKQLQHDTGDKGGEPCRRCGLVYSSKTAYVPCFEEGDTKVSWLARQPDEIRELLGLPPTVERCHASRGDGECIWSKCPQLRDNEPERSGRHCPLDKDDDE